MARAGCVQVVVATFANALGIKSNGKQSKGTYKRKRSAVETTLRRIVAEMTGLGQDQIPVAFVDNGDGVPPDPGASDYESDDDELYQKDLAEFKASLVGENTLMDGTFSLVNLISACKGQLAPGSIEHQLLVAVGGHHAKSVPPTETAFVYHKVSRRTLEYNPVPSCRPQFVA